MINTSVCYESSGKYCVYEHIFPDGKKYIGMSNNPERRWKRGEGYKDNKKMYAEIQRIGWDKIQHNIIIDGILLDQATSLEKYLIKLNNSIKNGYNTSTGGESGTNYYSKSFNKILNICKSYKEYINVDGKIDALMAYRDNEEFAIKANYIHSQIEKIPDYNAWLKGDQLMFCVHWLNLLLYGLAGNPIDGITNMTELMRTYFEKKEA